MGISREVAQYGKLDRGYGGFLHQLVVIISLRCQQCWLFSRMKTFEVIVEHFFVYPLLRFRIFNTCPPTHAVIDKSMQTNQTHL